MLSEHGGVAVVRKSGGYAQRRLDGFSEFDAAPATNVRRPDDFPLPLVDHAGYGHANASCWLARCDPLCESHHLPHGRLTALPRQRLLNPTAHFSCHVDEAGGHLRSANVDGEREGTDHHPPAVDASNRRSISA